MEKYQPNSHRSKELKKAEAASEPEKRVQKVVSGNVKTRKNEVRKFADIFISEDASNVKSYIFMDVLVPAIKKAISDIVTDGIDMILYGGSGGGSARRRSSSGNKVSYRSYYDDRRDDRGGRSRYESHNRFDYDDLVFENRGQAEAVREAMLDTIEDYGLVTVADMYDMADLAAPYTSARYGWTSIRNSEVKRVKDGYIINLPKAVVID